MDFTDEQVYMLFDLEQWWHSQNKQVFEISGAAGTGKTTCIKYFVEKIGLDLEDVLFVSYMGKACARMMQTGLNAKTIHSAIYIPKRVRKRDENGAVIYKATGRPEMEFKFELREKLAKEPKLIVVDEASMVPENIALDLLSYNIPVVALGDLNQLPPVFGSSFFLKSPDVHLTQVMRQMEGDPIVYLANRILNNEPLEYGVYDNSYVLRAEDLNINVFKKADIVLTGTNYIRYKVNTYYREQIKHIEQLDRPQLREKVIFRKNNWKMKTSDGYYLMNGITGFITKVHKGTCDGNSITVDVRPDFGEGIFKNVKVDYKHLKAVPTSDNSDVLYVGNKFVNKMEYAYAITVHSSQGSEFNNVVYLHEDFSRDPEKNKKLLYTAITRAKESITIVI